MKINEGLWASLLWVRLRKLGLFSLERRRLKGILVMNVNIWKGERKKMDTGSAQWHLEIGQEAMGTMRNTIKSVQTKKGGKLPCGWLSSGTGFLERWWSLHAWKHPKLRWHSPGEPAPGDSPLSRAVGCNFPRCFLSSTIQWIIWSNKFTVESCFT